MFYIITVQRPVEDIKKGGTKKIIEKYLTEQQFFAEAENVGYEIAGSSLESDVTAIERSQARELVNSRVSEEQQIYTATVSTAYEDPDTGKEKVLNYQILAFAEDLDRAHNIFTEYMKQGYEDMKITSIKKTKLIDLV